MKVRITLYAEVDQDLENGINKFYPIRVLENDPRIEVHEYEVKQVWDDDE